jgi:hypothetical protein
LARTAAIIAFPYKNTQHINPVELRPYHPASASNRFRAVVQPG